MVEKKRNMEDIRQVLESMRQEYWQALEEVESEVVESRDFLLFQLGDERFGIAAAGVREVVRMPARLVPVPKVASHIRGVFNLRGQIFAVSDLGPLLGLAASDFDDNSRLLVVEAAGLSTALLATSITGLRSIPLNAIEPVTSGGAFPQGEAFGQLLEPEGLVILLDLEQLFARPEFVVNEEVD